MLDQVMTVHIERLHPQNIQRFKSDLQAAFQSAYEAACGPSDHEGPVISEKEIEESLIAPQSVAYQAVIGEEMVGGAIVKIDPLTHKNSLELLYVKIGHQGQKIGQTLWKTIEAAYPETRIWETHTPYFDRRNIHFYVNACGFAIVEFYHDGHPFPEEDPTDAPPIDGFFRFEKKMF